MNHPQHLAVNSAIGIGGTVLAVLTPERAAIFAGCATGVWMLWQFGCSVWDRWKGRRQK